MYSTTLSSPLGPLLAASDGENLTGLWMAGQKYFGATLTEPAEPREDLPVFAQTNAWLNDYFAGRAPSPARLPLLPAGSPFRRRVWQLLCEIPYGEVTTYGRLAQKIAEEAGRPTFSAQAVGGAVGHNPISILIPCHRVIGADGSLTGYAGGIQKKLSLLKLEGVDTARFTLPAKGTAL